MLGARQNPFELFRLILLSVIQVPAKLQREPEVSRIAEVLRQAEGGARRHAAAIGELIDPLVRDVNRIR